MYRIRLSGEVKSQDDIRKLHPNTSFPKIWAPELLEELGLDPVLEVQQPSVGRYQSVFKDGVEQVNGKWQWKWTISDIDDEAKALRDAEKAKFIRTERDYLLSKSDWTQGKDIPDLVSAAWAVYRQALRDVPAQDGFPWNVTWPTKPE